MAVKLNLIPQELLISKSLNGILKTLRALNVILSVAFLIFAVGVGAFFIISKYSLTSVEKTLDQLKTQVLAQQSSEQRLILLKDRLAKISMVHKLPSVLDSITKVNSVIADLSGASLISEMDIGSNKIDLSMTIESNDDLTRLMTNIKNTKLFKTIVLSSFGYSPLSGYVLGVSFTGG